MQTLHQGATLQSGKYIIKKDLGQGGFGITYLAEHTLLGADVAIKEFFKKDCCNRDDVTSHVSVGSDGSREMVNKFREKFLKEARNIFKLTHPNIVRILDIFEENGTAYYVMEYCKNGSLADLMKQYPDGMPEEKALKYIHDVASAVDYVHQQKMNHLDIKPGNILLNDSDNAILIDFGLSKQYDAETGQQTSTTPVGISKGYAPIEQYKQGGVSEFSPATDIYSLGATLYKLITGLTPPEAQLLLDEDLPDFSATESVKNAIKEAMRPLRKDRPQSVTSFISLLDKKSNGTAKTNEDTVIIGNSQVFQNNSTKATDIIVTVEKEDLIDKYRDFKPRKKWKRPFLPTLLFTIASGFAIFLFGYACLINIDALSYVTTYDTVNNLATAEGTPLYYARCEGYTGTMLAYSWNHYSSPAQAIDDAMAQYWDWYKRECTIDLLIISILILISFLIIKFCLPRKKHGFISDFADTIEKYRLFTGFKSKYKLYIKDGKYGIANVSRYMKVTDPVFDKITWKDNNSKYYGTINGETKLYDVKYGELK